MLEKVRWNGDFEFSDLGIFSAKSGCGADPNGMPRHLLLLHSAHDLQLQTAIMD